MWAHYLAEEALSSVTPLHFYKEIEILHKDALVSDA